MSVATLNAVQRTSEQAELVPQYFDTNLIVTPADNPPLNPAILAELEPNLREFGQKVPGFVCPSPELPEGKLLCFDGNHRLEAARRLGLQFWAFNAGRFVKEAERIRVIFSLNYIRRRMSRDEIASWAAKFIDEEGCTQGEAASLLKVSPPTISRAFGERRIPPELKERADLLGLSIRSLIAAVPVPLMAKALEFAETPGPDGKKPTRDQVASFISQLKKGGKPKGRKAKTVTLRINGRTVTLAVGEKDSAYTVAEDLKAIASKLGKHDTVPADGWPFLFQ